MFITVAFFAATKPKWRKGYDNNCRHLLHCNRTKREGREFKKGNLPSSFCSGLSILGLASSGLELSQWWLPLQALPNSNDGGSSFKCSQALTMVAPALSTLELWQQWLLLQALLSFNDGGSRFKHSWALTIFKHSQALTIFKHS